MYSCGVSLVFTLSKYFFLRLNNIMKLLDNKFAQFFRTESKSALSYT